MIRKLPCIKFKNNKIFLRQNFLIKKKYIFNVPISMKFFLEIHYVAINLKSLCIFLPSSKLSKKNPLKKILNFLGWIYFGNFFWDNFELGKKIKNDFRFLDTWWISRKNFIEINMLNKNFFLKRKYFLEKNFFTFKF